MKKGLIVFAIGLIFGALSMAFIAKQFARSDLKVPIKVIQKSTVTQKTDIIAKSQTELSGKIFMQKSSIDENFGGKSEAIKYVEGNCKPGKNQGACRPICDFVDKNPHRMPLLGNSKVVYLDASGRKIGEGTHEVTGETLLTITQEEISVKTKINDISVMAVTVPEKRRHLHLGIGISASSLGISLEGYVEYNFDKLNILGLDISPLTRLSVNISNSNLFLGAEIKPP